MSALNEKRYFLKNSNLLEEIHKSKLTYCCYTNKDYENYDVICNDYSLVTPNIIESFFNKNKDRDYIIIRVMTDEHIPEEYFGKNGKVNLQEIKMSPFKHFLLTKKDFKKVFKECKINMSEIDEKTEQIKKLKEQIKDNKKSIRFNKLKKDLQLPYKEFNLQCEKEIKDLVASIKQTSCTFSEKIKTKMKEVLRSHWKGDTIEDGHFCIDHGRLTDALVHMLILLVDQYSRSGNWANYSWKEDMKSSALVHLCDVALKFEENKSSNAFSYLTQVASMKFTATLNSEKTQTMIKSYLLQQIGYDATINDQVDAEYALREEEWYKEHNSDMNTSL